AAGEGKYLVAEADAEDRDGPFDETRGRLDRVVAGLRVPRSVRQEDAVGGVRQGFLEARPGGHHDDLAAPVGEQAQDVPLDPEVVRDDLEARGRGRLVAGPMAPGS